MTGRRAPRGQRPSGPVASGRRSARERTLGLLYEAESKGISPIDVLDAQPAPPDPFTVAVVRGVAARQGELDALIGRVARGWRIERMPVVDRAVLRMGAFELCHRPDVPTAAAISEAVELAKKFSTDNSGRFVNGVLARIAEEFRPDAPAAPLDAPLDAPGDRQAGPIGPGSAELVGEGDAPEAPVPPGEGAPQADEGAC